MDAITLPVQLLQYTITGITIGSIYAMVAIGFNIIYGVTDIINFAQGEFVMLGGLVMVFFQVTLRLPLPLALAATLAVVTLTGLLLDQTAIRPVRQPSVMVLIIATIGASIVFKGLAMLIWGKTPLDLPPLSDRSIISLWGAVVQPQCLWIMGLLGAATGGLTLFFKGTITGKAMAACADNAAAAGLVGINVRRMTMLAFGVSAAIGALAGILITPVALMEYDRGAMLAVKGFGAAILGGLGSFPGAIVGGVLLGLIESLGAGLVSSGYKDAFALAVLLLALFLRPQGLLGAPWIDKV